MSERVVGRRQVLRGAGAVAGGVAVAGLAMASPALAKDDGGDGGDDREHRHGLTGSWQITRQDDGDPQIVQAVISFAGGGVLLTEDINPSASVFLGTWASPDGRQFRATFWTGSADPNNPGSKKITDSLLVAFATAMASRSEQSASHTPSFVSAVFVTVS